MYEDVGLPMSQVFVEQVAVLVLLHRDEEQARTQLQTKFSGQIIFIHFFLNKKMKKTIRKREKETGREAKRGNTKNRQRDRKERKKTEEEKKKERLQESKLSV